MVWSLTKIIAFVAGIAALAFTAAFIIETGGQVRLTVAGKEFTVTPLAGMIGFVVTMGLTWVGLRALGFLIAVLKFFNGDETAISRYFDRNRERRGFEALADGLMALASGEGKLALAKATKADRYLQRPELTLLLNAQAAELAGETRKAMGFYKKLLRDDRTRFAGVQGILKQKLLEGDTETALQLAEKALALRPKHEKTIDTLFALQSEKSDWSGARKTLEAKLKTGGLPRDVHTRRDAVLALADARDLIESGDIPAGQTASFLANKLSPDLVPAAVLASEMHLLNGSVRPATRVLRRAWEALPHPDLAAAFAEIDPDETPDERHARFRPLLKMKPTHPESRMLAAELNLVAEDYPAARKSLGDLAETDPTTRSLTIMAAIEKGEGADENVVRGWLTRALSASRGPQWMCNSCHHIHPSWAPVCESCAHFDTLGWHVPPQSAEIEPKPTDMLPIIVASLEVAKAEEPPEVVSESEAPESDDDNALTHGSGGSGLEEEIIDDAPVLPASPKSEPVN